MKWASWFVVLGVLAVSVAMPTHAQDKKEVQGYIAGGYVMPEGRAGDYLDDGWNISGGVIFRPAPDKPFGVRLDLGYSSMDANSTAIEAATAQGLRVDDGYVSLGNLTAEVLWEFGNPGKFGGYVAVGGGGYRRYAALTTTVLTNGVICDPWWGYCYPAVVTGQAVAQSDSLTKWGWSAAAGATFAVGSGQLYLEARYHWMMSSPTTEIFPVLIGYRF
jgi:hypothetical protein